MNKYEMEEEKVTEIVNAEIRKILFFGFIVRESFPKLKKFVLGEGESVDSNELRSIGFFLDEKLNFKVENNKTSSRIEDLTNSHGIFLFDIGGENQVNWLTARKRRCCGLNFEGSAVVVRGNWFDATEDFICKVPAVLVRRVNTIRR